MNILCVCGNGMGTSTMLKITVANIARKHGINVNINTCAFSECASNAFNVDLIITSPEWANMLSGIGKAKVAVTQNLIDTKEVEKAFIGAVEEHFPQLLK